MRASFNPLATQLALSSLLAPIHVCVNIHLTPKLQGGPKQRLINGNNWILKHQALRMYENILGSQVKLMGDNVMAIPTTS